jgi:hypothetical protein
MCQGTPIRPLLTSPISRHDSNAVILPAAFLGLAVISGGQSGSFSAVQDAKPVT